MSAIALREICAELNSNLISRSIRGLSCAMVAIWSRSFDDSERVVRLRSVSTNVLVAASRACSAADSDKLRVSGRFGVNASRIASEGHLFRGKANARRQRQAGDHHRKGHRVFEVGTWRSLRCWLDHVGLLVTVTDKTRHGIGPLQQRVPRAVDGQAVLP